MKMLVLSHVSNSVTRENRFYTYSAEGLFVAHQVNDEGCRRNEENFHERVVQTYEVHEEIEISDAENNQVQFLCLA